MTTIKEITNKFEVTRGTFHNWKSTKPKLYDYLLNSDNQYEKYREVNIFLETYIKTATNISLLEYKEIEYIVSLNLELKSLQEIENLHLTYINQSFKKEKEGGQFELNIYKKLESLNLIEKYIFSNRLKSIKKKIKKDEKEQLLRYYFKEFLK